jgi:hypothetical protein
MDVGRYLSISAAPNDGVLSAAAAVVVLVVLVWALMPQFWQVTDDLAATAPAHTGPRSHAGPSDATFPITRASRAPGTYQPAPRHAARPARMPRVTGAPPWEPAPRPPGTPPAG